MKQKVLMLIAFLLLLTTGPALASEGWIYSTDGAAYYSTVYSSESNRTFTWTGDVLNGKVHGVGIQTFYNDGKIVGSYEGSMNSGYREGYGKFSWAGFSYEGEWHQSAFNGKGLMITASSKYLGEFLSGKKSGRGIHLGDGTLQVGQFFNGRFIEPQDLTAGYFIIGLCTHNKEAALQQATLHRALGYHPIVTNSSEWENLSPGWYIVVYGVLENEEEIQMLKNSFDCPFEYDIKYSGKHRL